MPESLFRGAPLNGFFFGKETLPGNGQTNTAGWRRKTAKGRAKTAER
ncbi:hypothetical protein FACS1894147_03760 [Spirochaetia bacterium]|nr:hypothetical protein FACS1894147_03760 [Spirochaetia bacterium]